MLLLGCETHNDARPRAPIHQGGILGTEPKDRKARPIAAYQHMLIQHSQSAIWAVFVVCILFFTTRVAIRLKVYKKLLADDYWAVLAFIFLFVNSILLTVAKDPTFIVQGVQFAGLRKPKDFEHETKKFDDLQWAISNIFFSGLWSVKGSFLAFYKELTEGLPAHRRAWWFIVVVTVLTYVGAIVGFALWNRVLVGRQSCQDHQPLNLR